MSSIDRIVRSYRSLRLLCLPIGLSLMCWRGGIEAWEWPGIGRRPWTQPVALHAAPRPTQCADSVCTKLCPAQVSAIMPRPSPPPPSPPPPSPSPPLPDPCGTLASAVCAGQPCYFDEHCLATSTDPFNGVGCGAGGYPSCRACYVDAYNSILTECPELPSPPPSPLSPPFPAAPGSITTTSYQVAIGFVAAEPIVTQHLCKLCDL